MLFMKTKINCLAAIWRGDWWTCDFWRKKSTVWSPFRLLTSWLSCQRQKFSNSGVFPRPNYLQLLEICVCAFPGWLVDFGFCLRWPSLELLDSLHQISYVCAFSGWLVDLGYMLFLKKKNQLWALSVAAIWRVDWLTCDFWRNKHDHA